jgi:hypothetical protein
LSVIGFSCSDAKQKGESFIYEEIMLRMVDSWKLSAVLRELCSSKIWDYPF